MCDCIIHNFLQIICVTLRCRKSYLSGSKKYTAGVKLGFETSTLDMDPEGDITNTGPFEGITDDSIRSILPKFTGEIQQGVFLLQIICYY